MAELGREKDLVLSPNEYTFVRDETKGIVSSVVGSYKMSLSNSDSLVNFDPRSKSFVPADFDDAIHTFCIAPENWYIQLKNPVREGAGQEHPVPGSSNVTPEFLTGKKINIHGPVSFALYPGQMAEVIQGHRMHSNQYLKARVYDADALGKVSEEVPVDGTELDADGEPIVTKMVEKNEYVVGQIIIIKGSEVPFYMPPTGIEVLPIDGHGNKYVRNAVTLERLEYCILKNESGEKKYVHGPAVVFPEADEIFLENPEDGSYKFRAIELSGISGIYVKVIQEYTENGVTHPIGEELFLTGKDCMIYYPRPEHSIIDYDGRTMHHAIAIPSGEGRYVLNRQTGVIQTVKGPVMYLPDPRFEVVVKRKLTMKQCILWYPDNQEVLKHNSGPVMDWNESEGDSSKKSAYSEHKMASISMPKGISRHNTYTGPRTITIDNKFDGVVTVDVWTGYAINVISKSGNREVIVGPKTCLLDYDQTLDVMHLSTGKPKTTDRLEETVYLQVENNKVSDIIEVQTKDFVDISIKVSYCVNFLEEYKDKWFSIDNYVKFMCDRIRSKMKAEVKEYNVEEFYDDASNIIRAHILGIDTKSPADEAVKTKPEGMLFEENGMFIFDVEVLSIHIDNDYISGIIEDYQKNVVENTLRLSEQEKNSKIRKELISLSEADSTMENELKLYLSSLEHKERMTALLQEKEYAEETREQEMLTKKHEEELEKKKSEIASIVLQREQAKHEADNAQRDIDIANDIKVRVSQTDAIVSIMDSISPRLIASMENSSNAQLLESISENFAPYTLMENEGLAEFTDKLMRGTTLEGVISKTIGNVTKEKK